MNPICFHPAEKLLVSEDTDIQPLPVIQSITNDGYPITISCWAASWRERLAILFGRPIYFAQLSLQQPAILLTTDKREVGLE